MLYKTKAEQQREFWMTLPEVVAHIQAAEGLKGSKARHELLKALADNAFSSGRLPLIRWKDEVCISGKPPKKLAPHDRPPRGREWAKAEIRWNTGEVLDPYGAAKAGKWQPTWRVVWLSRSKVMQIWAKPPQTVALGGAANVAPSERRRTGPQSQKRATIANTMKADLEAKHLTTAQLRDMPDKELFAKYGLGAGRTTCRDARKQALTEFDGV